jgi:hypothetical protein
MSKAICEIQKNSREIIRFSMGEFRNRQFADVRIWIVENGKDAAPTKKGVGISPALWPQFREALEKVEAAMVEAGWLNQEDRNAQATPKPLSADI